MLSLDASSSYNGGDLDWWAGATCSSPRSSRDLLASAGRAAPQPVRSSLGYHIIQVLEVAEGGRLDAAAMAQQREQAFLYWLDQQRAAADIQLFGAFETP